jgi:hypothetical protein
MYKRDISILFSKKKKCPWIGNCVGKRNHRQFAMFLLFTTINGIIILAFSVTTVGCVDYYFIHWLISFSCSLFLNG